MIYFKKKYIKVKMSQTTNEPLWKIVQRKGPIKFSKRESLHLEKKMSNCGAWNSSKKDYKEEYFKLKEKVIDLEDEIERLRAEKEEFFKIIRSMTKN